MASSSAATAGSGFNAARKSRKEVENKALVVSESDMIIGKEVKVKGNVKFEHCLRILGNVDGKLLSPVEACLHIGSTGYLKGNAMGLSSVAIEGKIVGDIRAINVLIKASGSVFGDICCRSFEMEENSVFVGRLECHNDVEIQENELWAKSLLPVPSKDTSRLNSNSSPLKSKPNANQSIDLPKRSQVPKDDVIEKPSETKEAVSQGKVGVAKNTLVRPPSDSDQQKTTPTKPSNENDKKSNMVVESSVSDPVAMESIKPSPPKVNSDTQSNNSAKPSQSQTQSQSQSQFQSESHHPLVSEASLSPALEEDNDKDCDVTELRSSPAKHSQHDLKETLEPVRNEINDMDSDNTALSSSPIIKNSQNDSKEILQPVSDEISDTSKDHVIVMEDLKKELDQDQDRPGEEQNTSLKNDVQKEVQKEVEIEVEKEIQNVDNDGLDSQENPTLNNTELADPLIIDSIPKEDNIPCSEESTLPPTDDALSLEPRHIASEDDFKERELHVVSSKPSLLDNVLILLYPQNDYMAGGKRYLDGIENSMRHTLQFLQKNVETIDSIFVLLDKRQAIDPMVQSFWEGVNAHQTITLDDVESGRYKATTIEEQSAIEQCISATKELDPSWSSSCFPTSFCLDGGVGSAVWKPLSESLMNWEQSRGLDVCYIHCGSYDKSSKINVLLNASFNPFLRHPLAEESIIASKFSNALQNCKKIFLAGHPFAQGILAGVKTLYRGSNGSNRNLTCPAANLYLLSNCCAGLEEDELVMLRLDGVNITTSELSVQR